MLIVYTQRKERSFIEKHCSFKGRVNRKCYVIFRLLSLIPLTFAYMLQNRTMSNPTPITDNYLLALLILSILIPFNLSYVIRRWHDFGKSGYYCIINFIFQFFLIPSLILEFILCITPGTEGPNKYGESLIKIEDKNNS
nr:MAG TPA: Protein of unknown function (DUF805) [Caudoviricetes sp.]